MGVRKMEYDSMYKIKAKLYLPKGIYILQEYFRGNYKILEKIKDDEGL